MTNVMGGTGCLPAALPLAVGAAAVDEVEYRRAVLLVQFLHLGQTRRCHLVVPRHLLLGPCCRVADEGVVEVLRAALQPLPLRSAVDVREVVNLQLLQQLYGLLTVLQDGGHDHHRGVLLGDEAVLKFQLERAHRLVQPEEALVEEVDDHLAHRHQHQDAEHQGQPMGPAAHGPACEEGGECQGRQRHNPYIRMGAAIPLLGWEELPAHMLAAGVGLLHQLLHQLVFAVAPAGSPAAALLGQPHYSGAVVILRLVVHLVVHSRGLPFEHPFAEAHIVQQLRHGQLGHLLQRVEDIHHPQVVLSRLVQLLHIRRRLVGRGIVVGVAGGQRMAQVGQILQKHALHQRQQGAHLGVGEIVMLLHLHLREVAEQQRLVNLIMAFLHEALQHLLQLLHAPSFELAERPAAKVHLQHLLLLAYHIIIVQHPFIRAAHKPLRLGLFHQ